MKKEKLGMDPNLPRWDCQNCCHSLCVVGVDSYNKKFFNNYFSCSGNLSNLIKKKNLIINFLADFDMRPFWVTQIRSPFFSFFFSSLVSVFWVIIASGFCKKISLIQATFFLIDYSICVTHYGRLIL